MSKSAKGPRIYWRERGGVSRAYGDFRAYGEVGGGQEALTAPGEKLATSDPVVAQTLLAQRLKQLEGARRGRVLHGLAKTASIASFAREHLIAKARSEKFAERYLESLERQLQRACDYFGPARDLTTIDVASVRGWLESLGAPAKDSGRVRTGGTVRHHLNALSNLYRRAQEMAVVLPGYNPAAAIMEKPSGRRRLEARWLEAHEAALLLEAARTHRPRRTHLAMPFAYEMIAAFLLTGGRREEVLGLEVEDVSFDRQTVTFRPNAWRRLKTSTSARVVPLWPQLEEILRPYVFGLDRAPSRLLFPSYRTARGTGTAAEHMLEEPRKILDAIAERAGWRKGEIRTKMFRHTYCAARLQTLDRGAPVSPYTVGRELGHGGDSLVRRVYGHLGNVRHRSEVMEFRVGQHIEALGDRLAALR